MPVSKKRKKSGKPVQRATPVEQGEEHAHGPEVKPAAPPVRGAGKPTNPFVGTQFRKASQRGR